MILSNFRATPNIELRQRMHRLKRVAWLDEVHGAARNAPIGRGRSHRLRAVPEKMSSLRLSAVRPSQAEDDDLARDFLSRPDRRGHSNRDRDFLPHSGIVGNHAAADRAAKIL